MMSMYTMYTMYTMYSICKKQKQKSPHRWHYDDQSFDIYTVVKFAFEAISERICGQI